MSPQDPHPPVAIHSRSKRKRQRENIALEPALVARQDGGIVSEVEEVDNARVQCFDENNSVTTCFPLSNSTMIQNQWAALVWNSNLPQFDQTDQVSFYLFHGDSQELLYGWENQSNPTTQAGYYTTPINDSWWGETGDTWSGSNISYLYYWAVIPSTTTLDNNAYSGPTFTAVQTTYPNSIISSMYSSSLSVQSLSSASAASSSSAAAAASLSSLASASLGTQTASSTASSNASPGSSIAASSTATGNVQSASSSSTFPHWAIAVIVVLGFLAIVAAGVLTWLIMRRIRRRRPSSNRGSIGSASPMMANAQNPHSPQAPLLGGGVIGVAGGDPASEHQRAPSIGSRDGISEISRANSAGDSGPFSGADAAIMADAFRKALRKPDFAGTTVEEGESPDTQAAKDDELLNRELAEEGRDIRSVASSRGVRVETLSDAGDTVRDV